MLDRTTLTKMRDDTSAELNKALEHYALTDREIEIIKSRQDDAGEQMEKLNSQLIHIDALLASLDSTSKASKHGFKR